MLLTSNTSVAISWVSTSKRAYSASVKLSGRGRRWGDGEMGSKEQLIKSGDIGIIPECERPEERSL